MKFLNKLKNILKKNSSKEEVPLSEDESLEFEEDTIEKDLLDLDGQDEDSFNVDSEDTSPEIAKEESSTEEKTEFFEIGEDDDVELFEATHQGGTAEIKLEDINNSDNEEDEEVDLSDIPNEEEIDQGLKELMSESSKEDIEQFELNEKEIENEEFPTVKEILQQAKEEEEANFHDNDESEPVEYNDDYEIKTPSRFTKVKEFVVSKFTKKEKKEDIGEEKSPSPLLKAKNPEEIFKSLFSEELRPQVHRLFLISSVIAVSYMTGSLLAQLAESQVKPKSKKLSPPMVSTPKKNWREEIAAVKKSNPFNIKLSKEGMPEKKVTKKPIDENLVCEKSNNRSSLKIKLLHTIVLQDSVKSIASVQSRGKAVTLREGEKLKGQIQIGSIQSSRLIFKNLNNGTCEFVEMKREGKKVKPIKWVAPDKGEKLLKEYKDDNIAQSGNSFKIKKTYRDEMLQNVGDLLTKARAIPIKNSDGTLSFKMVEVVPGSLFTKLNIQEGDIIKSINGKKYSNINELMALFGQLKNNDNYEIQVGRDGQDQTFNYNFE